MQFVIRNAAAREARIYVTSSTRITRVSFRRDGLVNVTSLFCRARSHHVGQSFETGSIIALAAEQRGSDNECYINRA